MPTSHSGSATAWSAVSFGPRSSIPRVGVLWLKAIPHKEAGPFTGSITSTFYLKLKFPKILQNFLGPCVGVYSNKPLKIHKTIK